MTNPYANPYANPKDQEEYDHDREILANRDFYKRRDESDAADALSVIITILIIVALVGLSIGYRVYFMR